MTVRALFEAALEATRRWHAALPEAAAFCPWPQDLEFVERPAHLLPAAGLVQTAAGVTSLASAPLVETLQRLAPYLEWRHTYTVEQVGAHFLENFAWFELAGPHGHFQSHTTRITVGYWNAGLEYGRHQHRAEELYTVIAGRAIFMADGEPDLEIGPDGSRLHASDQPHALRTTDSPVLTLVFWRGDGLSDPPAMSVA